MKKLLNTLYVLTPDSYLFCRNETICVKIGEQEKVAVPALSIEAVVCFGKTTVSTPLIGFCAERGISLVFLSEHGQFLARVEGPVSGNVLLRKRQYESLSDPDFTASFVRALLMAKLRNSKSVLLRSARNEEGGDSALYDAAGRLSELAKDLNGTASVDTMRGIEGAAATLYFSCFDRMLGEACPFRFETRSRRPPLDPVNALLCFAYSLLSHDCAWALESVGLDSYVGFLHRDRPGRNSLALDLMEEFRPCVADRFVLTCINNRVFQKSDFVCRENGGVLLSEGGRRTFLQRWQERKKDSLTHPFLGEKVPWGLVPYLQALLLARYLRGDLDAYPPFLWK